MNRSEIEDRIRMVLENIVLQGYEITKDSTFYDMGLDSLDKIETAMDLEEEFDIIIYDEALALIDTFDELVQYIEKQLNKD